MAADAATVDPLLGQRIAGRYQLRALLGAGGMGRVYAAQHELLDKAVAVKLLAPELSRDPDFASRFIREAQITSQLDCRQIVEVLDLGYSEDGSLYYAMELLEGEDLQRRLERHGRLRWDAIRGYVAEILDGLELAHAHGIVHRDIKPSNCFVTCDQAGHEIVKLLDFGIAKVIGGAALTRSNIISGTAEYMAPEQAIGEAVDHRADIYAVGALIYALVAGRPPLTGRTAIEVLHHVIATHPAPPRIAAPDLPEMIEAAILRALRKQPAERFADVSEFRAALGLVSAPLELGDEPRTMQIPPPARAVDVDLTVQLAAPTGAIDVDRTVQLGRASAATSTSERRGGSLRWSAIALVAAGLVAGVIASAGPEPTKLDLGNVVAPIDALARAVEPDHRAATAPKTPVPVRTATVDEVDRQAAELPELELVPVSEPPKQHKPTKLTKPAKKPAKKPTVKPAKKPTVTCQAANPSACARSCEAGDGLSCHRYGESLEYGRYGLAVAKHDALTAYTKGCDLGHARACYAAGRFHRIGTATDVDDGKAAKLFDRSCNAGVADACAWLAPMVEDGRGVERDADRAIALRQTACAGNSRSACYDLGRDYLTTYGLLPRDVDQAIVHFDRGCELKDASACNTLGRLYADGKDVPVDGAKAQRYFAAACRNYLESACALVESDEPA